MWLFLLAVMINWKADFVTEPHDLQKGFIQDCGDPSKQYVAAFTGLQGGKSYGEADGAKVALYGDHPVMLPEESRGRTPMEVWIISKSYPLAESMFETFRLRTPDEMWATEKQVRKWGLTRGDRFTHWLVPRDGSPDPCPIMLRVRTASDPNSLRATNRLGLAICDELAHWKEMAWLNLQARALVNKTRFLIGTSPKGKNFVYRTVALPGGWTAGLKGRMASRDPKVAVHAWTSADNPKADKDHIARLTKLFGREYAAQELIGMFTDAIGFVYGEFDRNTMMVPLPSTDAKDYDLVTAGIDPGWTDPYAGCVWARWNGDGRWYQVWELHETQSTATDLAPEILKAQTRWGVQTWWTDKRRPTDIALLRKAGVKAKPNIDIHGETDKRTIVPMLAVCQGLMQQDKIRIATEHEATAEEFENYHYPDPSDDNPKNTNDNPVDWMNHHMDAMRYALCSVLELTHNAPRYRQGASQQPQAVGAPEKKSAIPTMAEALAFQDEKFDKAADKQLGGNRKSAGHFFRQRMRTRKELM